MSEQLLQMERIPTIIKESVGKGVAQGMHRRAVR
jgi:hypothetical protein